LNFFFHPHLYIRNLSEKGFLAAKEIFSCLLKVDLKGISRYPPLKDNETRRRNDQSCLHPFHCNFSFWLIRFFSKSRGESNPDLVELYSVGKSFEGRDIWQMTISNKSGAKDTDKPAMYLEGNRHSGEVTGAESALYFAWHVLTNYGKDPEIMNLVDTKDLYVRVKNNPDGSELYLNTVQSNRSTVRPHDSDGDGLLD
jgi:murein tripeptide amidase MpaA